MSLVAAGLVLLESVREAIDVAGGSEEGQMMVCIVLGSLLQGTVNKLVLGVLLRQFLDSLSKSLDPGEAGLGVVRARLAACLAERASRSFATAFDLALLAVGACCLDDLSLGLGLGRSRHDHVRGGRVFLGRKPRALFRSRGRE